MNPSIRRLTFLSIALISMTSMAHADTVDGQVGVNPNIANATRQWTFGLGILNQNYSEYNNGIVPSLPAILDSETGDITSFRFSYTAMSNRLYLQAILNYSVGSTAYTGYLQSGSPVVFTPLTTKTSNNIFEILGRAGYAYNLSHSVVVIPYAELGEYLWIRDVGSSTPYGISEDYFNFSLGVGAKALYSPADRLVLELGMGYGLNFLSSMSAGGYDFTLGNEPYMNVYASVDYRIDPRWHLILSADYRNWKYGQSQVIGGYLEPDSETTQRQYLVSLGYQF